MQVSLRNAFPILAFFLGGVLLERALVRLPLMPYDHQTILCLFLGIAPIPFLARDLRVRYASAWLTIGGAAGLILLARERLGETLSFSSHTYEGTSRMIVAGAFYFSVLMIGLVIMRSILNQVKKRAV